MGVVLLFGSDSPCYVHVRRLAQVSYRTIICAQDAADPEVDGPVMSDVKAKLEELSRDRINLSDPHGVRSWAKFFGVPELVLVIAVHEAGPLAKDVAMLLHKPWR